MPYIKGMKHAAAATLSILLLTNPLAAQETREMQEGIDLLGEGARLFLKGLMAEMAPAFEELEEALNNINAYHPPEVLPNGDIIIRRKIPLQVEPPDEGEVEL